MNEQHHITTDEHDAHDTAGVAHEPVQVEIERSVRFGRIIITGTVLGAVLLTVVSILFPVIQGADYTRWQAAGLSLVYGGAIGLTLSSLFALILAAFAKRKHGQAIVQQTDVR